MKPRDAEEKQSCNSSENLSQWLRRRRCVRAY